MNTLLAQGAIFFNKSKNTFLYGSLIIFTLVLEEIFQKVVFRCPCHSHFYYSLLFILGPTIFLFMVGILINKKTWRLFRVHGRCPRNTGGDHSKKRGRLMACVISEILFKALLAPVVWLILSFLQKKFYVCAVHGPVIEKSHDQKASPRSVLECHNSTIKNSYSEAQLMAFSQMCALAILIASTFVVLLTVCIAQCWKGRRNLQLPNQLFYKRIEAKAAAKEFHRIAKDQAQTHGKKAAELVLGKLSKIYENEDYLGVVSKAGAVLDYEYSLYYPDIDPLVENQRQDETADQPDRSPQSPECVFASEEAYFGTYVAVDGSPGSIHVDSEFKVIHDSGPRTSLKACNSLKKTSVDIKNEYRFKRSRSFPTTH